MSIMKFINGQDADLDLQDGSYFIRSVLCLPAITLPTSNLFLIKKKIC